MMFLSRSAPVKRGEPESAHRDTTECKSAALLLGLLLASPPAPRPKKDTR
jgi:hypothetical protein